MPLSSMDRGLMARLKSVWYWLIRARIFSLVNSMVSMAFSNGERVVWGGQGGEGEGEADGQGM